VRSAARAIRFTFEHMDLPDTTPGGQCEDYVEFYSSFVSVLPGGKSESEQQQQQHELQIIAGPFCGRTLPPDFVSNGTTVIVRFTTNQSRERSGFRFRFERIAARSGAVADLSSGVAGSGSDVTSLQLNSLTGNISRFSVIVIVLLVGGVICWHHILHTHHTVTFRR
jgi:hypothetical protein